ncbi:segregation and condensation protein A [Rhodovulum sp. DZ06]|uniref:segregation and condensation protein A n=1 Tax=Rhodovulum sp. DZ06 TaxID=3425126 RepID=UPI003D356C67
MTRTPFDPLGRARAPARDIPDRQTALGLAEADAEAAEALVVDVDGFEGPLDVLLTLARGQKVDLRKISILQLAEQYLAFVEAAKSRRIELAADYLVMAAWLAYLKSRLLLPPDPEEEGPSAEELADRLAWQLERLEAMRKAAAELMSRDVLGRDRFARGAPEPMMQKRRVQYDAQLIDLMRAYARVRTRAEYEPLHMQRDPVYSMEQALERLRAVVGRTPEWRNLMAWLPPAWRMDPKKRRSAIAACFAASLEMAKRGEVEIRQDETFGEISLRGLPGGRATA